MKKKLDIDFDKELEHSIKYISQEILYGYIMEQEKVKIEQSDFIDEAVNQISSHFKVSVDEIKKRDSPLHNLINTVLEQKESRDKIQQTVVNNKILKIILDKVPQKLSKIKREVFLELINKVK